MKNQKSPAFVAAMAFAAVLATCSRSPNPLPDGLQLEEHALVAAPTPDPLHFEPAQGTQEDVLGRHASDRSNGFPNTELTVDGNPAIASLGSPGDLVAVLTTSAGQPPRQTVTVLRGDEILFETDAGLPSPVLPLQGLWTYDGHWALEILFADASTWAGQIYIDGELVNQAKGFDEAFGFQLLGGKPFFFYSREGHVGFSYDNHEVDLRYEEIPHYMCCSESSLNPVHAQNMTAFFARQGSAWYYDELGVFDP